MKTNNLKGSLILCTAALIWGLAFVAQAGAAEKVPSFTFNALRSFIGALALLIFWAILNIKEKIPFFPKNKKDKKIYLKSALICGICLSISMNLQQFGIAAYPNEGVAKEARAGFLTALYVILVPIFSVLMRKKISPFVLLGGLVAIVGIYILCLGSGFEDIYLGDILIFCCAISFALHIMAVDKFVGFTGGVKLSIMQFAVTGIISTILALIFDTVNWYYVLSATPQILYLGIMSSGVAYTLQIVGQKYAEPAVASISMSLESVFAALGGVVISGNWLQPNELLGCTMVFIAIIVAQIPEFLKSKKR